MHSHQHLLLGGECLHLVARPAHHDRHFLKTVPAPFPLSSRPLSYITASLSRPQAPTAIDAHGNWPEHAHVGVWLRWLLLGALFASASACDVGRREKKKKTCPRQRKSAQKGAPALGWRRGGRIVLSCLIDLVTWIYNFKQEIKSNQHWAL